MVAAGLILLAVTAGVFWLGIFVCNYWMPVASFLYRFNLMQKKPRLVSFVPIAGTLLGLACISLLRLPFPAIPESIYWIVLIPEIPVAVTLMRVAIFGFKE